MTNTYARAEAVFLALDPAKGKSGATIIRPDRPQPRLVTSAVVTLQSERETFVSGAVEVAAALKLPLIVIAEEWDPPRGSRAVRSTKKAFDVELKDAHWNYPTILGIGEGWGRWTAEFERFGIHELDVIRVKPNVWRDALFGKNREKESDKLKKFAVNYILTRLGFNLPPDAAEATCIGLWAMHAPEVHKRVDIWNRKNKRKVV